MCPGPDNIFGHIPDNVAMTKYNTILRPGRKILIKK
jgi:hypothetical protein